MAAFDCRLRQVSVPRHCAIGFFGTKGLQERLFLRISDLLDVSVGVNNDFHSIFAKSVSGSWIVIFLKRIRDRLIHIHPFTYTNIKTLLYCYMLYYAGWVLRDIIVYWP